MTMECIFSVMTPKVMQYLGALCTEGGVGVLHGAAWILELLKMEIERVDSTCCTRCEVFGCEDLNDHVCQELMCLGKGC